MAGWGFGPGLWQTADQVCSSVVKTLGWAVRNGEQNCRGPGGQSCGGFGMGSRGPCAHLDSEAGGTRACPGRRSELQLRLLLRTQWMQLRTAGFGTRSKEELLLRGLRKIARRRAVIKQPPLSESLTQAGHCSKHLHVMNKQPEAFSFEIKNVQSFIVQPLGNFSTYLLIYKFYTILTWSNEVLYFKYSYTFKWGSF